MLDNHMNEIKSLLNKHGFQAFKSSENPNSVNIDIPQVMMYIVQKVECVEDKVLYTEAIHKLFDKEREVLQDDIQKYIDEECPVTANTVEHINFRWSMCYQPLIRGQLGDMFEKTIKEVVGEIKD